MIEADSAVSAPSGAQVPAFGLKLSRSKSNVSEVMLRDGAGGGLTIQTDDGGRILIPPGRLRLEWSHGMARPLKEGKVESYLKQLDGGYLGESDELEIFPYDRAEEFTLRVGHRVEVGNKLRPQPDPRAQETAYRAAAASVLIPVGLPKLKVLGGDDQ